MIRGRVNHQREIQIPLMLSESHEITALIDTGFNGYLTLPGRLLEAMQPVSAGTRRVELGDGRITELEIFLIHIPWNGKPREILAMQSESQPLVGMSLLWGHRLEVEVETDGHVLIEKVS